MTAVLQCPKCGADVPGAVHDGKERECKFCGAKMVFEAPAPVVVQQIVQPEVVRVVTVSAASGATSMQCPRCEVALFEGKAGAVVLFGCGTCGGVWLDNGVTQALIERVDMALLRMTDRATHAAHAKVDVDKPAKCPIGGEVMTRVDVRGVVVDACSAHGTWFDAGEVRRVSQVYEADRLGAAASIAASAGGATHDYAQDVELAKDNQRYAEGAMAVLGALLTGIAKS
jgi:Zn-finger nucleic acid-binding protein